MNRNIHFEQKKYRSRVKELLTLSIFTIVVAVISIIVMDIIILPIVMLAIKNKKLFNYIISEIMTIVILIGIALIFIKKIYWYIKEGSDIKEVIKYLLLKPVYFLGSFLVIILLTIAIIYILQNVMSFNNYNIFRFTQS